MRRFIYLDTDTLNSYIAQIYDGLVQSQETQSQSETTVDKQSERTSNLEAGADLTVFGKGIEGKMDFTYRHLKDTSNTELISDVQTKLLHDNAFDQLMNYLNSNNLNDEDLKELKNILNYEININKIPYVLIYKEQNLKEIINNFNLEDKEIIKLLNDLLIK